MRCKSCGKKLKKNEKFCTYCGYYNDFENNSLENDFVGNLDEDETLEEQTSVINNVNVEDENKNVNNYSLEETQDEDKHLTSFKEDRFIEAYIGEDYKWIMRRPINIYALLLSWMYFIYRKLYLIGILGLALTGVVLRLFPNIIVPYIVIVMVGSGLSFNKIYEKVINKRVYKIVEKNRVEDNFTIEQICQRKGGVNVPLALVIFFIFLVITLSSFVDVKYNKENTKFWDENTTNKANCINITKSAYATVTKNNITGTPDEAICEVNKREEKAYDIYLKMTEGTETKYIYFKDEGEVITLLGNTENIEDIEKRKKENKLKIGEEEFLEVSKSLEQKYSSMHNDSLYEDKLIKDNKNSSPKKHFIITEDEILR